MARDESPQAGKLSLYEEKMLALQERQTLAAEQAATGALGSGKARTIAEQTAGILNEYRPPALYEDKLVACQSEETKATFDAVLAPSNVVPGGRVMRLDNYTLPSNIDALIPEKFIKTKDVDGKYTDATTRQWVWTEFYQRDLRQYVHPTRALPASARVKTAA